MCGIVGAVAQRGVAEILLEGLRRLEYRGYDSAGVAIINNGECQRLRRIGKVAELAKAMAVHPLLGTTGVAHTRWATHGEPSERNAHPHLSAGRIAVVHNGIIENHSDLRSLLQKEGYKFSSGTDTEVIAHLVSYEIEKSKEHNKQIKLLRAVQSAVDYLQGNFALVILDSNNADRLLVARSGSPLVIGLGIGENFIASDSMAMLPVTRRFIFLEDGDVAEITREQIRIFDYNRIELEREIIEDSAEQDARDKGSYRHYMLKEIHEQPQAIINTLEGRLKNNSLNMDSFTQTDQKIFARTRSVQIVACGTSFHAAMVARYWFEELAGIPCSIEVASEFRYRNHVVPTDCLFVTISQSGETADTLAALGLGKKLSYMAFFCICNVASSTLVRECDSVLLTRAGTEIGVASTKAFTTQLTALLLLVTAIGRHSGMDSDKEKEVVVALRSLPHLIRTIFDLSDDIQDMAKSIASKLHCLLLGRGTQYPIAMEGALKLKEISYIHAEAFAAGELKHGPLALIDNDMPVIVIAPNNDLLEKLKSNMEEVSARGGLLFIFADKAINKLIKLSENNCESIIPIEEVQQVTAPILYSIPIQLLSYYVAVLKGTDVDQPRNLAKSVTVE